MKTPTEHAEKHFERPPYPSELLPLTKLQRAVLAHMCDDPIPIRSIHKKTIRNAITKLVEKRAAIVTDGIATPTPLGRERIGTSRVTIRDLGIK